MTKKIRVIVRTIITWIKQIMLDETKIIKLIALLFIAGVCIEVALNIFPKFILIEIEDISSVCQTIFGVQATIATLCLALIALISGLFTEKLYGLSIAKYTTTIKYRYLKHQNVIIINFVLIIVSCFLMLTNCINLLTVSMIITIILVVNMALDYCFVLKGSEDIEEEIEEFLKATWSNEYASKLNEDLISAMDSKNVNHIKKDVEFLFTIFKQRLENEKDRDDLQHIYVYTIKRLFEDENNFGYCIDKLNEVYRFTNKEETKDTYEKFKIREKIYPLYIWDFIQEYFYNSLKSICNLERLHMYSLLWLREEVYINMSFENDGKTLEQINSYGIGVFSSRVYDYICLNENLNNEIKSEAHELLIYSLNRNLDYPSLNTYDREKLDIIKREFMLYNKMLIDMNDEKINSFFEDFDNVNRDEEYIWILFVMMCYLYYKAFREPLIIDDVTKAFCIKVLKNYKDCFLDHIYDFCSKNDLSKLVKKTCDVLNDWEIMNKKTGKWMIMEGVVSDFYIILVLQMFFYQEQIESILKPFIKNNEYSLIRSYVETEQARERTVKTMKEIMPLLGYGDSDTYSDDFIKNKLEILQSILFKAYKERLLSEVQNKILSENSIKELETKSSSSLKKVLEDKLSIFSKVQLSEETKTKDIKQTLIEADTSLLYRYLSGEQLNSIYNEFSIQIIYKMIYNALETFSVKRKDEEKLDKVFNKLENLKINPTLRIGGIDFYYDDTRMDELENLTKKITFYKEGADHRTLILLDKRLLNIENFSVDVSIEDYTDEEIMKKCEYNDKDGYYYYTATNNLALPFTKDEITNYVRLTRKKVFISGHVKYEIKADKIGVAMTTVF